MGRKCSVNFRDEVDILTLLFPAMTERRLELIPSVYVNTMGVPWLRFDSASKLLRAG